MLVLNALSWLYCVQSSNPLCFGFLHIAPLWVFFSHMLQGGFGRVPTTGFWSLAKVFFIFPQSFWVWTKPHLVNRREKSALNLVRLETRVHHTWSSMQIWCSYDYKRQIETRNVMHIMAATIFIASRNLRYWLQDHWKRCSAGDAVSISPLSLDTFAGSVSHVAFGDKIASQKKRLEPIDFPSKTGLM
jgi:hypothetical protein